MFFYKVEQNTTVLHLRITNVRAANVTIISQNSKFIDLFLQFLVLEMANRHNKG